MQGVGAAESGGRKAEEDGDTVRAPRWFGRAGRAERRADWDAGPEDPDLHAFAAASRRWSWRDVLGLPARWLRRLRRGG